MYHTSYICITYSYLHFAPVFFSIPSILIEFDYYSVKLHNSRLSNKPYMLWNIDIIVRTTSLYSVKQMDKLNMCFYST